MMNPDEYAKILSHSQIFHGIDLADLTALVSAAQVIEPKPDTVLVKEENRLEGLHVILEGSAQVTILGKPVMVLGRGAFFGEISLFGVALGATASITVGRDKSSVLVVKKEVLDAWGKAHPQAELSFLRKMCTELARRLYSTSEKLATG